MFRQASPFHYHFPEGRQRMIFKIIGYFSICFIREGPFTKVKGSSLTLRKKFLIKLKDEPATKVKGTKADGGYLGTQRR